MATVPNSEGALREFDKAENSLPAHGYAAESDSWLITRVINRDEHAFTAIYDRYSRVVYSVALRVLRNSEAAEDVLHDVFLNLWRSPQQFDAARGNLAPWLAVVARNRAIDLIRKQRGQEDLAEIELADDEDLASAIDRDRTIEKVRTVLNALPDKQRLALELAFFQGMTHSDIAAHTGEPLGTIKTRIRSALMSVRKALER